MTADCRFCGQKFANKQAVRAHLKGCPIYQAQRSASRASGNAALGKALPIGNSLGLAQGDAGSQDTTGFDLVKQLEKQVAAGRLHLTLRELGEANAELDHKTEAKEHEKAHEAEQQAALARSAQEADQLKRTRDEQERREQERREAVSRRQREIIQEVKREVVTASLTGLWLPLTAKADALQEIERALSRLDVTELPRDELLAIARTARDRVYRAAEQNEREAKNEELLARKRAEELAERKRQLIQRGLAYAKQELEGVEDLSGLERWRIETRIERELQAIDGDEPWSEIEDQVEDILESEGIDDGEFEDDE